MTHIPAPPIHIEFAGISKAYPNGVQALQDIDLTIRQGEIFGIIGLSGAGKTSVLRRLEDSGYQCMDNIPPLLLAPAFTLCEKVELDTPVALGVDSRSGALFDADAVCSAIDQGGDSHEISILFLEADTETLIDRYKETRRDHPLMRGGITLEQAIA